MRFASPLRYPGGKWRFSTFFSQLIADNFSGSPSYIEPYAGGGSLALSLLFSGKVCRIWLNDLDPAIFACWQAMLLETDRFCDVLESTPVTVEQWRKQKRAYAEGGAADRFALGFATFFLNRTNHSGILNGGMIGGKAQAGPYSLDVRFNKVELIRRIRQVADSKSGIKLTCMDAKTLVRSLRPSSNTLVYLDPPYVHAGGALYMNSYKPADHAAVSKAVINLRRKWVVSYDDSQLVRDLYRGARSRSVELLHTARASKRGTERLFFSGDCVIPELARGGLRI